MNISCPNCYECVVVENGEYRCYNCKRSFRVSTGGAVALISYQAKNWANRCTGDASNEDIVAYALAPAPAVPGKKLDDDDDE